MKRTTDSVLPLPATLAEARARVPRHLRGQRKKMKNNYLAELALNARIASQKSKHGAGAPRGNMNAVALPHSTPEEIALCRRYIAWMKSSKVLLALVRAETRAKRLEIQSI
jgi:hypothetical protein